MSSSLGLFAKYWQPGQVKTRLAKELGEQQSATVYRSFVETLIQRLGRLGDERWLAFTPTESEAAFQEIAAERWQTEPQTTGNLGDRMKNFFDARFATGSQSVVLLGTDSPNVPIGYVELAFEKLNRCDVVLGSTEDGGYWLIGASHQTPKIFTDIPWSSPDVWKATISAVEEAAHKLETLPTWYDVDVFTDLQRLQSDLRNTSQRDEFLDALLQTINQTF